MFSVFFRDGAVANYDDARDQDSDAFRRFFHSMLSQGVHLPPSAFESWFVSASHDDEAVDHVLAALPAAARAAATSD
jgi:glutamate-1-semialdehyde 2,1-aminomutase